MNNANYKLFSVMLKLVEENVDHNNFRTCTPSHAVELLEWEWECMGVEQHEIIPTFLLLIEQCEAGLNSACTLFASEMLTQYLQNKF